MRRRKTSGTIGRSAACAAAALIATAGAVYAASLRLAADREVYRDGPARLRVQALDVRGPVPPLTVRALPAHGAAVTIYEGPMPAATNTVRLLDDFENLALPGSKDLHLGCVYEGGWEVGNRLQRSVFLSNSGHDDGPKIGFGALRMRYTGGLGGSVARRLSAPAAVNVSNDWVTVSLFGMGRQAATRIKVGLRGRAKPGVAEEMFYPFALIRSESSGEYIHTRIFEGALEDAIRLNFDGWREFRLPLRAFIPYPRETSPSDAAEFLVEVTGFEFLLDGVGTFYADELRILSPADLGKELPAQVIVWDLAALPNGTYTVEAACGAAKESQCVTLAGKRGAPLCARLAPGPRGMVFEFDGKLVAPVFHSGGPHNPPLSFSAYAAGGLNLHCLYYSDQQGDRDWIGPGDFNGFVRLDATLRRMLRADPDGRFIINATVDPPKWWIEAHPDEQAAYEAGAIREGCVYDGWYKPSLASEVWRRDAAAYLDALVRHVRGGPFADRVVGLWASAGDAGEWWHPARVGPKGHYAQLMDYSPPMQVAFRRFLRMRYRDEVRELRRAWGEPAATFGNDAIPSERERRESGTVYGVFRDPSARRRVIDYYECHNRVVFEAIAAMASAVKGASEGNLLFGLFGAGGNLFPANGETGYKIFPELMRLETLDMLVNTGMYGCLYPGGGNCFRYTEGSFPLHRKLFINQNDHTCCLYWEHNVAAHRAGDAAVELVKRDAVMPFVRGVGAEWFDMCFRGEGAYSLPRLLDKLVLVRDLAQAELLSAYRPHAPERVDGAALVVDDRTGFYLTLEADANLMAWPSIHMGCYELPYVGARVDAYSLSDVAQMPDYPVVIFNVAMTMSPEQRALVRRRFCGKGHTVLWICPPGMNDERSFDLARSLELMEIAPVFAGVAPPASRVTNLDDPLTRSLQSAEPRPAFKGQTLPYQANCLTRDVGEVRFAQAGEFSSGTPAIPLFSAVEAEGITVLARYLTNNAPAVAVRRFGDWTSIYSGIPYLPAEFLREVLRAGGVTIHGKEYEALWANERWLGVHTGSKEGPRTFRVAGAVRQVTEMFSDQVTSVANGRFTANLKPMTSYLWRMEAEQ
ncbi:MAG: beta-galactosidase [Kiritimatiellae bacterium]|nr:beta-galactosidase [Kiritimatiellia bacterium]